jgi:hypothetical protein
MKEDYINFDSRNNHKIIRINININKTINNIKKIFKRDKDDYIWVYECSLDPLYEKDFCIAENGPMSEPYCKHGLKLVRVKRKEV